MTHTTVKTFTTARRIRARITRNSDLVEHLDWSAAVEAARIIIGLSDDLHKAAMEDRDRMWGEADPEHIPGQLPSVLFALGLEGY